MQDQNKSLDNFGAGNAGAPILKSALYYGSILAGIGIAIGLIAHFMDWNTQSGSYQIITWVLLIGGIAWTIWDFKTKKNNGYLRYGQGVGLAVLTGLITGIISAVAVALMMKFMDPGMMDQAMEKAYDDMKDSGMSDSQISETMEMTAFFFTPTAVGIIIALFWTFFSLITGLIASAILKRD